MVRGHNVYDFKAFIFFDICFMAQNMVGLGEWFTSTWEKTVYSTVGWSILCLLYGVD